MSAPTAATALPAAPLAPGRFALPQPLGAQTSYLCGHSLGAMPVAAQGALETARLQWAQSGVQAWFDGDEAWVGRADRIATQLGHLLGAQPASLRAFNHLSSHIHALLLHFGRPRGRRRKILYEAGAFPSDRFALHSVATLLGLDPDTDLIAFGGDGAPDTAPHSLVDEDALCAAIAEQGEELNLLYWSGVAYLNGQAFDIARLTQAAQAVGAHAVFDLAHAAGNVALALEDWGVDAACWCHYKYLNAGPGAVGGLYLHPRHHAAGPPLAGWWGHEPQARFGAGEDFHPRPGAAGWESGTPPILGYALLEAALAEHLRVGMPAVARAGHALCADLAGRLRAGGLTLLTPPQAHGAMLSLWAGDEAPALFARLRDSGILGDLRPPGIIRLALAPLYNGPADCDRVCAALLGG